MTIEDRFDKEFGIGLYPLEMLKNKPFVIWLSKNSHVAYIDMTKLTGEIHDPTQIWFDFIYKPPDYDDCFVHFKDNYYRLEYIKKAISVLNPDRYNFVHAEFRPTKEINYLLILKKGDNGIMISPSHKQYVDMEKIVNMIDITKKTATSVFKL